MKYVSVNRALTISAICAAVLFGAVQSSRAGELMDAAAKAKKTGLPLFVMFSSSSCKFCVEMKDKLKNEAELNKLIKSQYIFVEADADDAESKKFIEHYKVEVKGVPHTCIVSAQGELVTQQRGMPQGDGLSNLLKEGIDKTGGMKSLASESSKKTGPATKLEPAELEAVVKEIAAAKEKLSAEDTVIEGMVELLAINRKFSRVNEVKKETGPIFGDINKDKAQKDVLVQARMLDSAAAAIESKKDKLGESTYQSVIKKYPDSAAAKYAQAKLDAMSETPASTEAADAQVAKGGDESAAK
jgi:glutaredoxin